MRVTMIPFDRIIAPALPILTDIEQNRVKHYNEKHSWLTFVRVLAYHFTMRFSSMRELATGLQNAEPILDLLPIPRPTISQMFTRFDPQLLRTALSRLLATIATPENPELALLGTIHLVDGSHFPTIHRVYWRNEGASRHVKLHLAFHANQMVAADFAVTPAQSSERDSFRTLLRPNITYVLDRGSMEFQLLQDVVAADAFVVLRAYNSIVVNVIEERDVHIPTHLMALWSQVRDCIVQPVNETMDGQSLRLVECSIGTTTYRLLTNRYDLTTFQIILLYAYRWQIELTFRALKWTMSGVHVITEDVRGIQSFFAGLFFTAALHIAFQRDCLAQEGYLPPDNQEYDTYTAEQTQASNDLCRPTAHLAIASFMTHITTRLALFWKIPKHWLKTLASWIARPFTDEIVTLLNSHYL